VGWTAEISVNGKYEYLGLFQTPEQAALAYDDAALKAWGEFAYLNFQQGETDATTATT
jgi:hypothetical protein